MSDIIDFKKIRLETFLIKFAKSNEIPNEFIDGTINVDVMYNAYKDNISEYHLKLLNKVRRVLASRLRKSQESIYESFMEEYIHFYHNQCTREDHWRYPLITANYRANLNPIRAIYYELLSIMNSYNPLKEEHTFIVDLFNDNECRNRLINCTTKDIKVIDSIISTYHYPLEKIGEKPFEFLYLVELKKDLEISRSAFRSMEHWSPDE